MVGETMQDADAKFYGFDILGILINYETITIKEKTRRSGKTTGAPTQIFYNLHL